MCFTAATGTRQLWYCGTKISCLWSRMVVRFPKAENYLRASGVWERPRKRRVLSSHSLKGQLDVSTLYPGGGGGGVGV